MLGLNGFKNVRIVERSEPPRSCSLPPTQSERPRILIIEDDPQRRDALSSTMELEGYEAHGATTSCRLGDIAAEVRPDVVLLGFVPSQGESYELCGELRARSRAPRQNAWTG